MDSDNPPQINDIDSSVFREKSVPLVHSTLNTKLVEFRNIFETRDKRLLYSFLTQAPDDINRIVVGAKPGDPIDSGPERAIVHALGFPIWTKPPETERLETEILSSLVDRVVDGQMDVGRFAKGIYFLQVLLHKYDNGNGRVARGMKILVDKSSDTTEISEDETKKMLEVDRQALIQTGETRFKINVKPDFERMVLGMAYFGLAKGLSMDQVTREMQLNGSLPEEGLKKLAQALGVPQGKLKEEYIQFMVVDADLEWCDFENE